MSLEVKQGAVTELKLVVDKTQQLDNLRVCSSDGNYWLHIQKVNDMCHYRLQKRVEELENRLSQIEQQEKK